MAAWEILQVQRAMELWRILQVSGAAVAAWETLQGQGAVERWGIWQGPEAVAARIRWTLFGRWLRGEGRGQVPAGRVGDLAGWGLPGPGVRISALALPNGGRRGGSSPESVLTARWGTGGGWQSLGNLGGESALGSQELKEVPNRSPRTHLSRTSANNVSRARCGRGHRRGSGLRVRGGVRGGGSRTG